MWLYSVYNDRGLNTIIQTLKASHVMLMDKKQLSTTHLVSLVMSNPRPAADFTADLFPLCVDVHAFVAVTQPICLLTGD